jgi:hypothetical protein
MNQHPNATAAGATTAPALLVIWLLGHFGVSISAEEGAFLVGAAISLNLLVGKRGIKGLIAMIWRGQP